MKKLILLTTMLVVGCAVSAKESDITSFKKKLVVSAESCVKTYSKLKKSLLDLGPILNNATDSLQKLKETKLVFGGDAWPWIEPKLVNKRWNNAIAKTNERLIVAISIHNKCRKAKTQSELKLLSLAVDKELGEVGGAKQLLVAVNNGIKRATYVIGLENKVGGY